MSLLHILYYPDNRLRTIAKKVTKINSNIITLIQDMFETMYSNNGIGLAATQINVHKKIIIMDISKNRTNRLIFINPQILETTDLINSQEGCLSIPNQYGYVNRYNKIKISALNLKGDMFILEATNLAAVCIQHEIDHLMGKLFIDYLPKYKRKLILQNIKKKT